MNANSGAAARCASSTNSSPKKDGKSHKGRKWWNENNDDSIRGINIYWQLQILFFSSGSSQNSNDWQAKKQCSAKSQEMNRYFRSVLNKQNFKDLEEAKTACKKGCDSDEACKFAALTNVPSSATCKFYDDKANTCIFETVTHADANNHQVYVKSNANQI